MKKMILLALLATSSAFAGNSQIGSSETQSVCGDEGYSTYEMRACAHGKAEDAALKIKAAIVAKQANVKERMTEEQMDASYIKRTVSQLGKVPNQIEQAVSAYCIAEGAEETSIGSIGGVVVASCMSEKMEALKEIFK